LKAEDLSAAYGQDAKAADKKYGGQVVELTGASCEPLPVVARSVDQGKPSVLLYGMNGPRVRCLFRAQEGQKVRQVGANAPVGLLGRVRPRGAAEEGPIVVEDCQYLQ
jgi:hypothetical protein